VELTLGEEARFVKVCIGCGASPRRTLPLLRRGSGRKKRALVLGGLFGIAVSALFMLPVVIGGSAFRYTGIQRIGFVGGFAMLILGARQGIPEVDLRVPLCDACQLPIPRRVDYVLRQMTFLVPRAVRNAVRGVVG
jgi:hypothetical protein